MFRCGRFFARPFDASAFCNRIATNPRCADVVPRRFGTELIPTVSFVRSLAPAV